MEGKEETQVIAARVRAPVAKRLTMLLLTKGYEEAERYLDIQNSTFAAEEWWPPVCREMNTMLMDFVMDKRRTQMEQRQMQAEQQRLLGDMQHRQLLGAVHITNMMSGCNNEETSVGGNMYNVKQNREVNING